MSTVARSLAFPFRVGQDGRSVSADTLEAQVLQEQTGEALRDYAMGRKDREILRKRKVLEAKISSLQTEFESVEEELNKTYQEEELAS